jgi:hypothetical protein
LIWWLPANGFVPHSLKTVIAAGFRSFQRCEMLLLGGGAIGVGAAIGVGLGVGSTGFKTGLGDGFGAALIATPLFQTSFLPDFTHVNFLPEAVAVAPALVHLTPALGVAACTGVASDKSKMIGTAKGIFLFKVMASSLYLCRKEFLSPCSLGPISHLGHSSR